MRSRWFGENRRLLFRSYLLLVAGVMAVAVVLEIGLDYLESRVEPSIDPWLDSALRLVEFRLAESPLEDRDRVATDLGDVLGVPIRLLDNDDVSTDSTNTLFDSPSHAFVSSSGETFYIYRSESMERLIYVGPVPPPEGSILFGLISPAFYVGVFFIVGLWLRPLLRDVDVISRAAKRFSADYREPTNTADRTSELTLLATNLDAMSLRLSETIQSQKELIAALSHEMRTPLARIRFALAVADRNADDELRSRFAEMVNDVQEIDDLIATMLDFARLDHPDLSMQWQSVPTAVFLDDLGERYASLDKTLLIDRLRSPDSIEVDRRLMTLAASNLLSNAMRYADSQVSIAVESDNRGYVISVEDDGDGIPASDRDTIFKAFTRLDDSRARETGGYGLGLAIVARIASLHGGRATADMSPNLGGARLQIVWPPPPKST